MGMGKNDQVDRCRKALLGAENATRKLVAEAAEAGDYDAVSRLTVIARHLADLAAQAQGGEPAIPADTSSWKVSTPAAKGLKQKKRKKRKKSGYPKFVRQGDELVKIGWSKKQKSEYRHKALKRVVFLVADALARATANSRMVTSEGFFPLEDPGDAADVPTYQAYVALAWLVHEGLAEKHGRQGYTCLDSGALVSNAEERWGSLSARYRS